MFDEVNRHLYFIYLKVFNEVNNICTKYFVVVDAVLLMKDKIW